MSGVTHGMDLAAVEELGRFLQQRGDRLRQIVQEINRAVYAASWEGGVAVQFGQQQWPAHRARLSAAADHLHGLGQSALNNATEQRSASDVRALGRASARSLVGRPGGGLGAAASLGAGLAGSAFALGPVLRSVNEVTSLAESAARSVGTVKRIAAFGMVGDAIGRFGDVVEGFTIGEELAQRRYVDAGLSTGLLAGDHVADAFKAKPTPVSYLAGATIQTWVEVGREARNVDWSANGLRAIQNASLSDWSDALGEASKSMPSKLVSIFSW